MTTDASKKIIIMSFDRYGIKDGKQGVFLTKLKDDPGIHGAGSDPYIAIRDVIKTAKSFGESGERKDYIVIFE